MIILVVTYKWFVVYHIPDRTGNKKDWFEREKNWGTICKIKTSWSKKENSQQF